MNARKVSELVSLRCILDEADKKEMKAIARISITSFFVVCMTLDSYVFSVPKFGSSFCIFGSKYLVRLIFKERHLANDDVILEAKVSRSILFFIFYIFSVFNSHVFWFLLTDHDTILVSKCLIITGMS